LGTVLFPGVVLPLHVFEPRYRLLVRRLMASLDQSERQFGVVGIRQGWEVGADGARALYEVGCTAELRQVTPYDDGRFDIVTVGRQRFRLHAIDTEAAPYLSGSVEWLPEAASEPGEPELLARSVGELFFRCRQLLRAYGPDADPGAAPGGGTGALDETGAPAESGGAAGAGGSGASAGSGARPGSGPSAGAGTPADHGFRLPEDPLLVSHLVAATAPFTLEDRQSLLAAASTADRLRQELRLLKREVTMLSRLRAVPVPLAELRMPMGLN
jgi:hypothetical protein